MWESIGLCRKAGAFSGKSPENAALGVRTIGKTAGPGIMYKDKYRHVATLVHGQRKSWRRWWETLDSLLKAINICISLENTSQLLLV